MACRLNVGNLRNTGHSTELAPPAAKADDLPVSSRAERLLHFVTGHAIGQYAKVGSGHSCDSPHFCELLKRCATALDDEPSDS